MFFIVAFVPFSIYIRVQFFLIRFLLFVFMDLLRLFIHLFLFLARGMVVLVHFYPFSEDGYCVRPE